MNDETNNTLLNYAINKGNIAILKIKQKGIISYFNEFSRCVAAHNLEGKNYTDFFIAGKDLNIFELAKKETKNLLVNVQSARELGQTLYFDFFLIEDTVLCIGQQSYFESESTRAQLMDINAELAISKRELQKRASKIEHLSNLKSRLLSYVSHDLRNPIGAILGYSKLIIETQELPPPILEILERIIKSSNFLLALLNDLLDLSQMESGKFKIKLEKTNLNEFIEDILSDSQIMASEKKINIVLESQVDQGMVLLDRVRLRQILENLLSNAVKYSPEGARVRVVVEFLNDEIKFSIIDQGYGIPKQEFESIFDEFSLFRTREDKSSKGLGLAVVKRLVEALHGSIWLESEIGKGTIFYFKFPRRSC